MPSEQRPSSWLTRRYSDYTLFNGAGLLRSQLVLLAVTLAVSAIQLLLLGHAHLISVLVYTFVAGNVTTGLLSAALPLYDQPFPRDWIVYVALLLPVSFVASAIGGVANRLALGIPLRSLLEWGAGADIPYAALICFIIGVAVRLFASTSARLEAANGQLAQQVQLGQQKLASQASELRDAFEIQSSLLPRTIPQIAGAEISCAWQPARTVSGDYFDVLPLSSHRIAFCLADVSGKGMSAALITANLQATLRAFAPDEPSPARLCHRLNQALAGSLPTGRFVTLAFGILDLSDRRRMTLTWELAGHNPMLLLRGAQVIPLHGTGPVLGMLPGAAFADQMMTLEPGDRLLVSTDGVTEAYNPADPEPQEEFGEDRMVAAAVSAGSGAHAIRTSVMAAVSVFARDQFHDDASLLVVQIQS